MNAQTINFGKFPSEINNKIPLATSELLKSLDWENLKQFSKANQGHYVYEDKDSLLVNYEYIEQGRVTYFKISSYNDKVMEFESRITNSSKETETHYFDKTVWLEYSHNYLTNLPENLKLTIDESKDILKAYYKLLGVGTRDEYGWICEYSSVGMLTDRRSAVIKLLENSELLLELLNYQNVYVQLYVADALLYLNKINKVSLTKTEFEKIKNLRDSNQKVNICGNAGSYKLYGKTTSEILSEKSISKIQSNYELLKKLGYLRQ